MADPATPPGTPPTAVTGGATAGASRRGASPASSPVSSRSPRWRWSRATWCASAARTSRRWRARCRSRGDDESPAVTTTTGRPQLPSAHGRPTRCGSGSAATRWPDPSAPRSASSPARPASCSPTSTRASRAVWPIPASSTGPTTPPRRCRASTPRSWCSSSAPTTGPRCRVTGRTRTPPRSTTMMKALDGSGRTVYWLGAPTIKDEKTDAAVVEVNAVAQEVAKRHPKVHYVDTYKLFSDTDGTFAYDLPDENGTLTTMRARRRRALHDGRRRLPRPSGVQARRRAVRRDRAEGRRRDRSRPSRPRAARRWRRARPRTRGNSSGSSQLGERPATRAAAIQTTPPATAPPATSPPRRHHAGDGTAGDHARRP